MAFILLAHAIVRWVLLAAGIIVVAKALIGWLGKQPFTKLDDQLGLIFTIVVDIQVLLGLILWLFARPGLRDLAQAMSNGSLRFIVLEHPILMLIALTFAHMGRSRSKKATAAATKHRVSLTFYILSLVFIALIFVLAVMG